MDQLITELRKAADWLKAPAGFHGAVFLAKRSKTAAPRLGEYVASLPEGSVGAWMAPLLTGVEWVTTLPVKKKQSAQGAKPKTTTMGGR
jgi:hypothetical protein